MCTHVLIGADGRFDLDRAPGRSMAIGWAWAIPAPLKSIEASLAEVKTIGLDAPLTETIAWRSWVRFSQEQRASLPDPIVRIALVDGRGPKTGLRFRLVDAGHCENPINGGILHR